MMKRLRVLQIIALISILLSAMISNGQQIQEPLTDDSNTTAAKSTFIMGTILNPVDENGTVSAKVISLFYYESSGLVDNMGFVRGFTKVEFQPTRFLFFTYSPGPFGLLKYVIGFCTDFEVIN